MSREYLEQQILDAKKRASSSDFGNLSKQEQNAVYRQSNEARDALKGMGTELPSYMAKGTSYDEARYGQKYTNQIGNEIDRYQQQANAQFGRFQNQANSAINRNNDYLKQQISQLQEQKAHNDQSTINLQNRRGGFYSGGLDYQLGQNARATQQATGQVQSEIASRNAELNQQVANYQQEISDKVNMLRQQAPDQIRQLVDQALQRQQQTAMQEAQLTGQYQGAPTLAGQQQQFNQDFQQEQFAYQQARDQIQDERWKVQFDEDVRRFGIQQALQRQVQMGNLAQGWARQSLNEQQFNQSQQNADTNRLMEIWQNTGQAPAGLENYGVQPGTPYQEYRNQQEPTDTNLSIDDLNNVTRMIDNSPYIDEYNEVADQNGLRRYIISLDLPDSATIPLLQRYGLPINNEFTPQSR